VSWKADSNDNLLGQLDKSNPALTHVSDALDYHSVKSYTIRTFACENGLCHSRQSGKR
jgi:hypothetical protein